MERKLLPTALAILLFLAVCSAKAGEAARGAPSDVAAHAYVKR